MSDLEASISTLVFDVPLRALDLIDELGRRSPASLLEPSNLLFHERPSMASAVARSLKDVKPVKPPASVFNGMFLLPSAKPWVHSACEVYYDRKSPSRTSAWITNGNSRAFPYRGLSLTVTQGLEPR